MLSLKRCVPRSVAARRAGRRVPRGIAVELVATPCAFVGAARDRCPIEEASLAIRGSAYERGHVARRQWRGLLSSCYVSVLRAARWGVWEISSLGERQPSGRSGCRAVGSDQVRRSDELSELPALWPKRLSASPGDRAAVLPALRRPRADPGADGNLDSSVGGSDERSGTQVSLIGPATSRTRAWSECSCGPATDHVKRTVGRLWSSPLGRVSRRTMRVPRGYPDLRPASSRPGMRVSLRFAPDRRRGAKPVTRRADYRSPLVFADPVLRFTVRRRSCGS